jgi:hypothetical protein
VAGLRTHGVRDGVDDGIVALPDVFAEQQERAEVHGVASEVAI